MRVLTVIQARLGSTRLPGKVLRPLGNGTVLSTQVERVKAARTAGQVVIAIPRDPGDDSLAEYCRALRLPFLRGHATDLLDRHYQAMRQYQADVVVKIPSDCPLIHPEVIDRVIGHFLADPKRYDFVSNLHPQSYPDGNDVEVISSSALATAWREATRLIEREHTTPFFWDNPERFRIANVAWETGRDLARSHRWTLDYAEDYELIFKVWEALGADDSLFTVESIVEYLARHPEIYAINEAHRGDSWYRRHQHELKTWGEVHANG